MSELTPHCPQTATESAGVTLASATASERITDFMIDTGAVDLATIAVWSGQLYTHRQAESVMRF